MCNKEIKFKAFLEYALKIGADYLATGHYVQVDIANGQYRLLKGIDQNKDQTYFLCMLGQNELSKILLPLGKLTKKEVREIARKHELYTAEKKDSTGLCFIGERNFKKFLGNYLPAKPGVIKTIDNINVGSHEGLMYYTLGQRKGLGIGGEGTGEPWFVVDKDIVNNILYVAQGENHPALYSDGLVASSFSWISGEPPSKSFTCSAKFRYRQPEQHVTVNINEDNTLRVTFDVPQRAVTPGQFVVFYQNEVCIGGGVIDSTLINLNPKNTNG